MRAGHSTSAQRATPLKIRRGDGLPLKRRARSPGRSGRSTFGSSRRQPAAGARQDKLCAGPHPPADGTGTAAGPSNAGPRHRAGASRSGRRSHPPTVLPHRGRPAVTLHQPRSHPRERVRTGTAARATLQQTRSPGSYQGPTDGSAPLSARASRSATPGSPRRGMMGGTPQPISAPIGAHGRRSGQRHSDWRVPGGTPHIFTISENAPPRRGEGASTYIILPATCSNERASCGHGRHREEGGVDGKAQVIHGAGRPTDVGCRSDVFLHNARAHAM